MNNERSPSTSSAAGSWLNILFSITLIFGLALLLTLDVGGSVAERTESNPLKAWLRTSVGYIATGAEIAAALVIGLAVVRGILGYVASLFGSGSAQTTETIRLKLGRVLRRAKTFSIWVPPSCCARC